MERVPNEMTAADAQSTSVEELEVVRRRRLRESLRRDEVGMQAGCMKAFESYAAMPRSASRKLNEKSLRTYEGIWLEWVMFVAGKQVGWANAKPDDVAEFLTSSLRARNLARNSAASVSTVTQARYARVLREIYAAALAEDEQHLNPVKLVGTGVVQSEGVASLRLHGGVRNELREGITKGDDAMSARDTAVVCLTLLEGMTCADIMGLKLQDLLFEIGDDGVITGGCEAASAAEMEQWKSSYTNGKQGGGNLLIPEVAPRGAKLSGSRMAQERKLAFTATTREAMRTWLGYRKAHRNALMTNVVMLSLSRRMGRSDGGITYRALFQICAKHLDKSLKNSSWLSQDQVRGLMHIGPNTLRNVCLLSWMEGGVPLDEVRRRAGLKEVRSLNRLADKHRWEAHDSADALDKSVQAAA
jgi:integrase